MNVRASISDEAKGGGGGGMGDVTPSHMVVEKTMACL